MKVNEKHFEHIVLTASVVLRYSSDFCLNFKFSIVTLVTSNCLSQYKVRKVRKAKASDVNKDWTHKDPDKDKDQSHKDKDKD